MFKLDWRTRRPDFFDDQPFREWCEDPYEETLPYRTDHPTQLFYFELGRIWLAYHHNCDRGRYMANLDIMPGLHPWVHASWPRYFFDQERAKTEIATWLTEIERLGEDWQPPEAIDVAAASWQFKNEYCEVVMAEILAEALPNVGRWVVNARSFNDSFVCIDAMDLFPRMYYDRDIAIAEAIDWLLRQGQYNPEKVFANHV